MAHGGVPYPALVAVGRRLAEFHAAAAARDGAYATAALQARARRERRHAARRSRPTATFARRVAALARFTEAFFAARRGELEARAAAGRVRDGHGDLRAEHVLLEHGVEIVDCLEFDPALRIDRRRLRPRVPAHGPRGARITRSRRAPCSPATGTRAAIPGDDALLAFFAVYRALVRAKVALVRAGQSADRTAASSTTPRARLALAERFAWRARQPGLVIFAGLSATGKTRSPACSPTAQACGNSTPTRCASSCSASPPPRAPARRPTAASFNRRTYEELGRLARAELERAAA